MKPTPHPPRPTPTGPGGGNPGIGGQGTVIIGPAGGPGRGMGPDVGIGSLG